TPAGTCRHGHSRWELSGEFVAVWLRAPSRCDLAFHVYILLNQRDARRGIYVQWIRMSRRTSRNSLPKANQGETEKPKQFLRTRLIPFHCCTSSALTLPSTSSESKSQSRHW